MPLFRCSQCGCVENTASSNYWSMIYSKPPKTILCSECDPEIGEWHGLFEKKSAIGMLITDQGFLYAKEDKVMNLISSNITIVGEVTE